MPGSNICWEKIEKEADVAIEKKDSSLINFEIKKKEECVYIQKYLEFKLKDFDYNITIAIYLIGLGIAALSLSYIDDIGAPSILRFVGLLGIIGGVVWIGSIIEHGRRRKYITIKEIILKAEKKIQSDCLQVKEAALPTN